MAVLVSQMVAHGFSHHKFSIQPESWAGLDGPQWHLLPTHSATYQKYGVTSHGPGDYEVDHLIPLELGGSNSIKNLWPESHRTSPWNAQVKDRLESKLHELVCSGQLDLKTAQRAVTGDWIEAYKMYVSSNPPISRVASPSASESPLNAEEAWVNTKSGKYWKPGSRYYGKTKQGEYMFEKEAVQEGYLPANGTGE